MYASGAAGALAGWAEDAIAVGLVHEKESAMVVRQVGKFGEGRQVAVHGKEGVGEDEARTVGGGLVEGGMEGVEVAVGIDGDAGTGQAAEVGG